MRKWKKKIPEDNMVEFKMFSIFKRFSLLSIQLRLKVNAFLPSLGGIGEITLNKPATKKTPQIFGKRIQSFKYLCMM